MQKIFLCFLLGLGMLYAEVRVPKPWNPGFFDGGKNPAERADVFRLGLLWTEPMEGVDYQVLGFAAEWGNARYYSGISFESVFLDSLYRSENFGLDLSFSTLHWTWGAGGSAAVQIVPGEASWWEWNVRVGCAFRVQKFGGGVWGTYPGNGFEKSLTAHAFWMPGESFQSGILFLMRQKREPLWIFQERFGLGLLALEGSLAFPGPKVGIGLHFQLKNWGAGVGIHRDSDYMNSKMVEIDFQSQKKESKFRENTK